MGANNTKSTNAAKPEAADSITVRFPYELVRWTRSTARKTGTTEVCVTVSPDDIVVASNGVLKLADGAEILVTGIKRDGKTRGMRSKHVATYTKPVSATADDDSD